VLYNATVFKDEDGVVQGVFARGAELQIATSGGGESRNNKPIPKPDRSQSGPMVAISPEGKITDVNEAW